MYLSPPSWWSGLKYGYVRALSLHRKVSTLVVEWIEITKLTFVLRREVVSTLVVEWIEM